MGITFVFWVPSVLETVLEAARQKTNVVPYLNRSPLFIGYGFYNYDIIIAPLFTEPNSATQNQLEITPSNKYPMKVNQSLFYYKRQS